MGANRNVYRELGQDNEEGCAAARVHLVQIQNASRSQAMQAVRITPLAAMVGV
jgi:hypothetical protein